MIIIAAIAIARRPAELWDRGVEPGRLVAQQAPGFCWQNSDKPVPPEPLPPDWPEPPEEVSPVPPVPPLLPEESLLELSELEESLLEVSELEVSALLVSPLESEVVAVVDVVAVVVAGAAAGIDPAGTVSSGVESWSALTVLSPPQPATATAPATATTARRGRRALIGAAAPCAGRSAGSR
jgi:hypothetical protein